MLFQTCFLFLALLSTTFAVPLQWESSSCAQSCNSDPLLIRYSVGKTYFYDLESNTQISYGSSEGLQSVGIRARVELSAHTPCELSLQLREISLTGVQDLQSFEMIRQLEAQPLQFGLDDGRIVGVCPSSDDELWAINVKKSIISALQITAKSTQTKSIVTETDILGNCETVYQPISRKYSTIVLQKTKVLNRCAERQRTQIGFFPRQYGLNEVFRTSAPIVNSSFVCSQTIDKDLIIGSTCEERQLFWPSSIRVDSGINLRFQRQITGLSAKRVQQFTAERHQLLMSRYGKQQRYGQNYDESDVISLLRGICSQIQNDVLSPEITESFPELVQALEQLNQQNTQNIYSAVQSGEICSSPKLRDLFLDASALATTEGSTQVLVKAFRNGQISNARANYLFSLLAFSSNPSENSINPLLPLLQSSETPKQVVLGISSLIHNLRVNQNSHINQQIVRQSIDAIVQRIQNSKTPSEIISLIKSLENIGVESHSSAKQLLVELATNSRQKQGVRVSALKALTEASDDSIRQKLIERVFKQQSEANEVRIAAYKSVVLSGASRQQLEQIRDQVRRDSNQDLVNYVRSHQKNLRETSDPHKRDVLPESAPEFRQPNNQWWGSSRNYEWSYLDESTQIGFSVESDVVFPTNNQQIPRSITFNTSVPIFGRELQALKSM